MLEAKYDWQIVDDQDPHLVQEIVEQCQLPRVLANLLVAHGYQSVQDVQLFLHPQVQQIQLPNKLHDMDKAVSRIRQAIEVGDQITVYGDYDADGMTATALMYETLETLGAHVNYYIPNRFKDGYGPNQAAYERLINDGTKLIVTVDNGVTGKKEIEYANQQGCDVVVTDHHSLPSELPKAAAIVHPQFPGDEYQFGDLSGVGVAFKVAWALLEELPSEMLDLVAVGEIADLVSMSKENHVLVSLGLQQLQQGLRPGVHALLKLAGVDEHELTSQDVAFKLAPRLNALGRIDDGNEGVRLLTTVDEQVAEKLAKKVDECNQTRQQLVQDITKEAMAKATAPDNLNRKTLLIVGHGWHQGVLGIVASKIVEATGKPTIIASVNDGELVAKGSGRSVEGYDLFSALNQHRQLMTAFGGHTMACGMSFLITQVPQIAKALETAADAQGLDLEKKERLEVAGTVTTDDLTTDFYQQIQRLAPFGPDNAEPVFEIDHPQIARSQQIGKNNEHLKFTIADQHQKIDVLAFNHGQQSEAFAPGTQIKIVGTVSLNVWRGRRNVQFLLKDQIISGTAVVDLRTKRLTPEMFQKAAAYVVFNAKLRDNIDGHTNGEVVDGTRANTKINSSRIVIVDTPREINELKQILKRNNEASVITLLLFDGRPRLNDDIPSRQQFVQLFQLIRNVKSINLQQQGSSLLQTLKVTRNQLILMIKVFLELRFVTMTNGLLKLSSHIENGRLDQTQVYQRYEKRLRVERTLLNSDSRSLVQWVKDVVQQH